MRLAAIEASSLGRGGVGRRIHQAPGTHFDLCAGEAATQPTLAELGEHGYEGLTVDGVAVRSGVRDPNAAPPLHAFFAARHEQASVLVDRAIARGELPEDTDGAEVVRLAVAPLYYRLFVTGEPIDASVADRAADAAWAAACAGVLGV